MREYDLLAEKLRISVLLAIVGGFLDAYSYVLRGGVFANAETGNMVLFGINLIEGNYSKALYFCVPIISYFSGIQVVEAIRRLYLRKTSNYKNTYMFWRQGILLIEIIILTIVGFLPLKIYDSIANVMIAFVCALQVQAFQKVHGLNFASTMCTGNLIKSSTAFSSYFETKDKKYIVIANKYLLIIISFICGALIGSELVKVYSAYAIFFCNIILVSIMLEIIYKTSKIK